MSGPPFLEVTEMKGCVLLASSSYRKSCLGTPGGSEERPGTGCSGDWTQKVLSDRRWERVESCARDYF